MREIKTEISSEVPIVDIEICNDISTTSGDWEYKKSDIISCAIFYLDSIKILLREKTDNINSFKKILKEELDKLPTMYAFNYRMEKESFIGFLGKSYFVEEIKSFKGKGWSKQKFFEVLVKDGKINKNNIPKDELEMDSSKVLNKYFENDYQSIIEHNIADVIKQYFIWKNKGYILKKYEKNIDKNGWYSE